VALIFDVRVRETSITEGTIDFVLAGRMRGSIAFGDAMATGDTCDYCASYDDTFEEGLGTLQLDGSLARTTVYKSRHANGVIDQNKVSFAPGVKTIIMTFAASRFSLLPTLTSGALRFDTAQSLSAPQKAQVQANFGFFPSGTRMVFHQTAAPTGWTKDTSINDKSLRIVAGPVGSGGVSPFSTVFGKTATDGHSVSVAESPSTTFTLSGSAAGNITVAGATPITPNSGSSPVTVDITASPTATFSVFQAGSHQNLDAASLTISGSAASGGSGSAHTHPMDIRVQYVDVIIASKD
jgi:hypothetical protein